MSSLRICGIFGADDSTHKTPGLRQDVKRDALMFGSRVAQAVVCFAALLAGAEAREARTPTWDKIARGREAGKPMIAVIGLRQQKITVYDAEGPILQAPVSTGRRAYETPAGVFTVLQKNKDHVSNLYEDAEMPFMQRVTWSGIALHAGALPGYRASHGCVRLPYGFAKRLFDLTSVGTRVVIAPNKVEAISIAHPVLEGLRREGASATAAEDLERARELATSALTDAEAAAERAEKATAAARRFEKGRDQAMSRLDAAVRRAKAQKGGAAKGRADAQVQKLRSEVEAKAANAEAALKLAQSAQATRAAAESRARAARLRAWPLSILISLKTQQIYVRQGFEPLLEMPAIIKDPQKAIGTHAFYATETAGGERGWLGVTLTGESKGATPQILDRVKLPQEVTAKLASSAWSGSALIVTDEAPHKETAAGTDFIVVLSTEPQGALRIRSPEPSKRSLPVAQARSPKEQEKRAYRAVAQDQHFRHPLGSFP